MPKYINISGKKLALPGIGVVEAGGTITRPDGFNNANFHKVVEVEKPKEREKIIKRKKKK